jgi:hypothetical protein
MTIPNITLPGSRRAAEIHATAPKPAHPSRVTFQKMDVAKMVAEARDCAERENKIMRNGMSGENNSGGHTLAKRRRRVVDLVYIAIREMGGGTHVDISRKTGIRTSTLKAYLDGLRKEGRVTAQRVGGVMVFTAVE